MSEDATCLCSVAEAAHALLPRLFLDVRSSASVRNGWARARSAIDTCATYTMVTASFLRAYGIDYDPGKPRSIVAVDGKPVKILGETDLQLQRMDGPVSLPRVHVKACVVGSLAAVGADILLGADVIAGVGGVSIGYGSDGEIDSANFGPGIPSVSATAAPASDHPLRHVTVTRDAKDVTLAADDGQVHWDDELKKWTLQWRWKDGQEPSHPIGSGIGQYARTNLSAEQETQFCDEVDSWVEKGWLVEHDEATHGSPTAIIPLLAKSQAHKSTTPVHPCLDYRGLNNLTKSNPGMDAPACAEKIRKWRQVGGQYELVDVRKAYLQVHVDPAILRYQVVVWRGKLYVMTRMGFGLSIAPKFMDVIVRWVTQPWPEVDNYVDDVLTPADEREDVVAEFARYSLPTKPAEPLSSARVLGLQLSTPVEGDATYWSRRDGVDLAFQRPLTKRAIFQWTGRLTSHYPVGSWLRPACSYLKRMASVAATWDEPVPERVVQCAEEVADRLQQEDPVRGNWQVTSKSEGNWAVFFDVSDIATGVALQHNGNTIEDRTWLRDAEDINVAELDACVHGLSLAAEWGLSSVRLVTDSKTVFAWLQQVADKVRRVRLGGLHKVWIERRLQVVADLLKTARLSVSVEWVPTDRNPADELTRVPVAWLKSCKPDVTETEAVSVTAAVVEGGAPGRAITRDEIREAQRATPDLVPVLSAVQQGKRVVMKEYEKVQDQLVIDDGILSRSFRLPAAGRVTVPLIPETLVPRVLEEAHRMSGHASWTVMYGMLLGMCHFPSMNARCQDFCRNCQACSAANSRGGATVPQAPLEIPGQPWSVLQVDTLELGHERSGRFHCVLVCTDVFTKWVEVVPLRRHDAASVARAMTSICCKWGPPDEVRLDNGTEFQNAVVRALFIQFGVRVKTGAVRHPQSQGCVERMNRTIITLMRKVLDETAD
ncbi:uncharacterized protein LOC135820229 [Sycon ciliatum]|uniref:uncharacterized protein LOC135820229 n=1 Tax=Sycon ciliatum TaxID=27933 RepID=UPI0031F64040